MDKTIRFESRLTRFRHCFPSGKEYSIVGRKKKEELERDESTNGLFRSRNQSRVNVPRVERKAKHQLPLGLVSADVRLKFSKNLVS